MKRFTAVRKNGGLSRKASSPKEKMWTNQTRRSSYLLKRRYAYLVVLSAFWRISLACVITFNLVCIGDAVSLFHAKLARFGTTLDGSGGVRLTVEVKGDTLKLSEPVRCYCTLKLANLCPSPIRARTCSGAVMI